MFNYRTLIASTALAASLAIAPLSAALAQVTLHRGNTGITPHLASVGG